MLSVIDGLPVGGEACDRVRIVEPAGRRPRLPLARAVQLADGAPLAQRGRVRHVLLRQRQPVVAQAQRRLLRRHLRLRRLRLRRRRRVGERRVSARCDALHEARVPAHKVQVAVEVAARDGLGQRLAALVREDNLAERALTQRRPCLRRHAARPRRHHGHDPAVGGKHTRRARDEDAGADAAHQRHARRVEAGNCHVASGEALLWARDANQPRLGAQGRVGDMLDIAGRSRRQGRTGRRRCLLFPSLLLLLARVVSARMRAVGSARPAPVAAGVRLDDARRHTPRLE
mmetsp:Transcript_35117/g.110303  ORF Transcript_35117/g.110303 Transcript_35117/m.110303 type:complete len:287 (-) Transcript_35117:1124-1984(-)